MDFCRVLESWDWLSRFYYSDIEVRRPLKNLFLETTFEIIGADGIRFPKIKVRFTKEFDKKVDKIVQKHKTKNINKGHFYLEKEHVRFMSFVDIWEEKRRA